MGTLSLAAPLVLFEKSRLWAGTRFHLLPSFLHHPIQHNNTTLTVTLTSSFSLTLYRYSSHTQCGLPKRCVILKRTTLNAIYPPCVEPEARNSAVAWHWNTYVFIIPVSDLKMIVVSRSTSIYCWTGGEKWNLGFFFIYSLLVFNFIKLHDKCLPVCSNNRFQCELVMTFFGLGSIHTWPITVRRFFWNLNTVLPSYKDTNE